MIEAWSLAVGSGFGLAWQMAVNAPDFSGRSGVIPPFPPAAALLRLTRDLDRWGTLFLQVAGTKRVPAVEQVLGGLVEWMGSDLLEGWLHLPLPLFEELSNLSEELFLACRAYLARLREATLPVSGEERQQHEQDIGAVLGKVQSLTARGIGG